MDGKFAHILNLFNTFHFTMPILDRYLIDTWCVLCLWGTFTGEMFLNSKAISFSGSMRFSRNQKHAGKNKRPELDHLMIHLYSDINSVSSTSHLLRWQTKPKQRCHWCWSGWLHRYARVMPVGGGTKDWFKLFKLFKLLDSAVGYRALPIVKERSICSLFIAVCDSCWPRSWQFVVCPSCQQW